MRNRQGMSVKLPDKASTTTFLGKIDIERVPIQFEKMVEVYDIRVMQQLNCLLPISLPINSTVKGSISVCIRLQDDQLHSNPRMTI
jgi:hypothetical protein